MRISKGYYRGMIYVAVLVLLIGCTAFDERTTPRTFDCSAICEGCDRCEVLCETTGQGSDNRNIKVQPK